MDILFVKLGALGDVINTLPLAVEIKKQMDASIHWLVAPLSYSLIKNHAAVDKVILFDKNNFKSSFKAVIRELKTTKFDLALDLQRTLKSGAFTLCSKADRKIGFDKQRCKEMTWLLPFERIPAADPKAHMLDQYMEFAAYLGLKSDADPVWDIPVFGQKPVGLPADYIVLNIGATKAANKWLPEYFAELNDSIFEKYHLRSVLTGGPEDIAFSDKIAGLCKREIINYTGKTSIGDLAEILRGARYTISCDTGPMHLSVAVNTKTIGLFGPSTPERTGPYKSMVIQKKIECSPCNKKECGIKKYQTPECMRLIRPEDLMAKITC